MLIMYQFCFFNLPACLSAHLLPTCFLPMALSVYQVSFCFHLELETVAEKVKSCLDRIDGLLKEDESQEQLVQVNGSQHVGLTIFSNC
jgi:hypothetical protein